MAFIPISIHKYVRKHLENNPSENEKDVRNRLNTVLSDYKQGIRCSCGNDIWVVGSASVGNNCFSCTTGESYPKDDYELDSAIKKRDSIAGRRHIDAIPTSKINGLFTDAGYEINTNFVQKPSLCITCSNDDDPNEKRFCDLMRYDQRDDVEFRCGAYKSRDSQKYP